MKMINLTKKSLNSILNNIDDIENKKSLDIFAREGDWQTKIFIDMVNYNESWEINSTFVENFKLNYPTYKIICRDSIKYINESNENEVDKFDIVIVDNGLNCYGSDNQYCEHFDVIDNIYKFFNNNVFVILNVVSSPFNYEKCLEWKNAREIFYESKNTDNLSIEFLTDFYKNKFFNMGYKSKNLYIEPREMYDNKVYLYYFAFDLIKR